jgi:hypothetical protein
VIEHPVVQDEHLICSGTKLDLFFLQGHLDYNGIIIYKLIMFIMTHIKELDITMGSTDPSANKSAPSLDLDKKRSSWTDLDPTFPRRVE